MDVIPPSGPSLSRSPLMATVAPTKTKVRTPPSRLAAPEVYRMTVDEYERLANAAVLDDERVELIDGYLVRKRTVNPPHAWTVAVGHAQLGRLLPPGWFIREEKPVRIPQFDEPEPDLSLIRGQLDDYRDRHPEPEDIALLVEVSDSTLPRDRGEKRAAYARGRIPVYWIINLVDRQVEVYSRPGARGYRSSRVYKPGQTIPVVIAGRRVGRIAVADILP
jgi:Uma2 family endonuclease